MKERVLTLSLVVAIAVVLGIGITIRQANDPLLRRIVAQQTEILEILKKMDGQGGAGLSGGSYLDNKLTSLDKKVDGLTFAIKNLLSGQLGNAAPQRQGPPPEDYTKVHDIPAAHSPVRGNKNAAVTIVAFDDYECPFCARFHPPILEVLKEYPNDVNFMIKNFPLSFHPNAKPAAKAAMAAGEQGKYFEMADALLADNKGLNEERFKKEAEKLGLNIDKFMKDYQEKDAQWEEYIKKDMELGAKVGVRGTPTFFINGRKTTARDAASYKREIEAILKEKKK